MINRITTLKELCSFQEGYVNPPQGNSEYFGNDIKWLRASDLNGGKVFTTERKLSRKGFLSAGKSAKMFKKGTIAISKSGTIGALGILEDEMCGNRAVINIEVDQDKADLNYIFYTLKYKKNELLAKAGGSIQKNLYVSALETLEINHSCIEEQKKISSVLSALDQKIELNNKINHELEAMAKTLYDYWFVQFDFPDENGKPYKSSGGKMEYNSILKREIPLGWEVASLVDIATFTNGLACQKFRPENTNDSYKVIKIREFSTGFDEKTELVTTNIPQSVVIKDGDVLFSWSATLDLKIWTGGIGALNQHIFKVTSNIYPKYFYFFELQRYLQHFKMIADLRKTTMGHITKEHLNESRICLPPEELINKLGKKIQILLDKTIINNKQNIELNKIRDWLLPMLMNGQVNIE